MSKALLQKPGYTLVERIVTNKCGQLMRVTFAVATVNGVTRAQVIKAEKIQSLTGEVKPQCEVFLLGGETAVPLLDATPVFQSVPSPYVFTIDLFFRSQMTRAPARLI